MLTHVSLLERKQKSPSREGYIREFIDCSYEDSRILKLSSMIHNQVMNEEQCPDDLGESTSCDIMNISTRSGHILRSFDEASNFNVWLKVGALSPSILVMHQCYGRFISIITVYC